jgi:hypothetical protein
MDDAVWVPPFAYGGLTSGPVGIENVIDASVNAAYPPRVFPPRIRNPHEPRAAVEHAGVRSTRLGTSATLFAQAPTRAAHALLAWCRWCRVVKRHANGHSNDRSCCDHNPIRSAFRYPRHNYSHLFARGHCT